jgi:hypothetical protein
VSWTVQVTELPNPTVTVEQAGPPSVLTIEGVGPQGPRGEVGAGLNILGTLADPSELPETGEPGDAWLIDGDLYVWSESDEWIDVGDIQGPQGEPGEKGDPGDAATINVGTVTTVGPDNPAVVTNSGSSSAAVFDFDIPQGVQGDQGVQGVPGEKGDPGDAATVDAGTVTTVGPDDPATVTNSGTSSAAIFDFGIPQGVQGDQGDAATVDVGTTTTVGPDDPAAVTNSGTSSAAIFDFDIPQGVQGDPGDAATIAVGTVTTVGPADPATVTNSGTSSAAVFDFGIPQGVQGDQGETGAPGEGVAAGGTTGQVLAKASDDPYDTEWVTPSGGGGESFSPFLLMGA